MVRKSKDGSLTDDRRMKIQYFKIYTILFLIAVFAVFSWYFLTGRTLLWETDGWVQHYNALVYYAKYLRSVIRGIFSEHRIVFPSWDFHIGEGNDIFGTLHYYVIGDPFNLLSVFVPTRFMYVYHLCMTLLRLYLAGIAFSCLCFSTKRTDRYAVLAGTLAYIFCFWGIYNAARHPYFLNPMIYYPMLLMGVEKILKKQRPYLFVVSVFLSAVSSLYFFYMLVLLTVIYVGARMLSSYRKKIGEGIAAVCRIGAASVAGLLMAFVIFLPACYIILNDPRATVGNTDSLLYPRSYYSMLPGLFLSEGISYWLLMGYAAPVLLAVLLLFYRRRKYGLLKGLFLTGIVIMLVPILGRVFNGFSYINNRWCWAFALLGAYILTVMWPELMRLNAKEGGFLFGGLAVYACLCFAAEYSRTIRAWTAIGIALFFLIVILPVKDGGGVLPAERKQQVALLLVFVSVVNVSFWKNSPVGNDYPSTCKTVKEVAEGLEVNETAAVKKVADADGTDTFYRYSGNGLTYNADLAAGLSSTQYYWTLSNPNISEYRKELALRETAIHKYEGYDDRAALLALSSVLYYVVPAGGKFFVPYGFVYVDTIDIKKADTKEALAALKKELHLDRLTKDQIAVVKKANQQKYKVYRNEYALPMGYVYDGFISRETWDGLSPVAKQEALLQGVVTEQYQGVVQEKDIRLTEKEMDYEVICKSREVSEQEGAFVVTADNATVTLKLDGISDSETYLCFEGLKYESVPPYDLYLGEERVDPLGLYNKTVWDALPYSDRKAMKKEKVFWSEPDAAAIKIKTSAGNAKRFRYYTEAHNHYNDRHDFAINLGYSQEPVTQVSVTFEKSGVYSFDAMRLICQPMEGYRDQIAMRRENVFEKVVIGTDTVTGEISLEKPGLLCLSIPYAKGWSAYVDGKEAALYQANVAYMALDLDAGVHSVTLVYHTPLRKAGLCISAGAFLLFFLYVLLRERKVKARREGEV